MNTFSSILSVTEEDGIRYKLNVLFQCNLHKTQPVAHIVCILQLLSCHKCYNVQKSECCFQLQQSEAELGFLTMPQTISPAIVDSFLYILS